MSFRCHLETLEPRCLLAGIVNGGFDSSAVSDTAFGWELVGPVSVEVGRAVLREDAQFATRLEQSFQIPSGATELRFDLHAIALDRALNQPPDTLEVALLDAQSLTPLVGTLAGVPGADALFSLDADDRVRFGTETIVPGAGASGDPLVVTLPLTVTVDVSAIPADTEALLIFELLGFGDAAAALTLDDVQLAGDLPPRLTIGLDPASDSGRLGDRYTNAERLTLIGKGPAGEQVTLDVDDDGFDDAMTTIGVDGTFRFESIAWGDEINLRVRAENVFGETVIARQFTRDIDPPLPTIVVPTPATLISDPSDYIEVVWSDGTASGIDDATVDTTDVVVDGVDIDRVERLGNGRVRYHYADDGDELGYGPIQIRLADEAIRDIAGNPSSGVVTTFSRVDAQCAWHNAAFPTDVSHNGTTTAIDALRVINELHRRSVDGRGPELADPPPPDRDFSLFDVSCDGRLTPLDALRVINYLLRQEVEG